MFICSSGQAPVSNHLTLISEVATCVSEAASSSNRHLFHIPRAPAYQSQASTCIKFVSLQMP